jgi:hypothetical protein
MTTVYECPQQRRDVLTASGESMSRQDAEALGYTIAPYADLVAPSARIATQHPEYSDLVRLPPFGLTVTDATARTLGFAVSHAAAVPRSGAQSDPESAWRSSIYALSEARQRPAATAEVIISSTPETLTVEQARAFLRGLPVEAEHTDTTEETTMTTNDDPRAARRAEIARSMNAFNKSRGYEGKAARVDAKDIDPARLKRLAEIKYSALHASGKGMTQEAKLIRLALDTHDKIGTPLVQTLSQLGVDASKLIPNA